MSKIKGVIKKLLGPSLSQKLGGRFSKARNYKALIENTYTDGKLFYRHSMVFKQNTFNKIESRIVLHYHGIEKGFLHSDFRYRFGKARVEDLIKLLTLEEVIKNKDKTQIAAAYLSMCKYYERHEKSNIDISDFYSRKDYEFFKELTTLETDIINRYDKSVFFKSANDNFLNFSNSRGSVRSFTGELIPLQTIEKVIELAKNAPSVCNRQPTKVYYVDNKEKIENILRIQEGLTGYTDGVSQLMVVVSDRNYFYTVGERNQLYIDGGLFLMNLLYALHYYEIGACPLHWGHNKDKDQEIMKEISLSESEKVICVVAIGVPKSKFKTTLSLRRDNNEVLKIV